jgi:sugar transferase (PEP-CTERM system associated)
MIRLFKHYIPHSVLLLGLLDFLALVASAEAGWMLRAHQIGMAVGPLTTRMPSLVSFAAALQLAMVGVGIYGPEALQSVRFATARLIVAVSLGVIFLSIMHVLLPELTLWRSNSLYAMILACAALLALRLLFGAMLGGEGFKRRLVVLGAGRRAERIRQLAQRRGSGFRVVGYIAMNDGEQVVADAVNRDTIANLADFVVRVGASEVILALEERRNAIPMADLLRIRTTGVHVNDLSTFLERETGRVDLETVNPSWLIFSDGFTASRRLSAVAKRLFDILASAALLALTAPLILLGALLVRTESKGPAFARQLRVGRYGQLFPIFRLRTLEADTGEGDPRITRVGRWLQALRLDELPLGWTVLRGDMSFVGPRPEQPAFVEDLAQRLRYYEERHVVKPGITGWAQINHPSGASIEDARHKLEYDLYYAKNCSPFLDLLILLQTIRVVLWPEGALTVRGGAAERA